MIVRCGAPTGEVNVLEVPAADWAVFSAQNADGGGYGIWVFERPPSMSTSTTGPCNADSARRARWSAMADELTAAGIEVLASRKGKDGLDHIAVCGASTGAINVFTISQAALAIAEHIGLRPPGHPRAGRGDQAAGPSPTAARRAWPPYSA